MSQDDCSSSKSQRPALMTANDYVLAPNLHAFLVSLLVPFTFLILQQGVKNTNVKVLNLCLLSFLRYFIYSQSKHFSLHLLPQHHQLIVFPRRQWAVFTYKIRDNTGHIKM
jgi:hypothetical protein